MNCPICDFPQDDLEALFRRLGGRSTAPSLARTFAERVCDFTCDPTRARRWLQQAGYGNRVGQAIGFAWAKEMPTWSPLEAKAAEAVILAVQAGEAEPISLITIRAIDAAKASRVACAMAGGDISSEYDWQIAHARSTFCRCIVVPEMAPLGERYRISSLAD